MTDDEERYDEAELARARALAVALDQPPSAADDPALEGALAAALALRAASFDEEAGLQRARARIDARGRRLRYALAASTGGLLAAAAAVLLLLPVAREPAPAPRAPAASASLDVAPLTAAQRAWLDAPTPENSAELARRLRDYREQYLASLQRRYAP